MRSDRGTTAIEYGLIASLVIVVLLTTLQNLGNVVLVSLFNQIASAV